MTVLLSALAVVSVSGVVVGGVGMLLGLLAVLTSSAGSGDEGAKAARWARISAIVFGVAALSFVVVVLVSTATGPVM